MTSSTEEPALILAEAMKDLLPKAAAMVKNWEKKEAPSPKTMRRGPLAFQFNFFIGRLVAKVEEWQTQTQPNTGNGNLSPTTFAISEPIPQLSLLDYPQTSSSHNTQHDTSYICTTWLPATPLPSL